MLLARDGPGDRERAKKFLDAALATYRELGMESYAAKADALAQEVGSTAESAPLRVPKRDRAGNTVERSSNL